MCPLKYQLVHHTVPVIAFELILYQLEKCDLVVGYLLTSRLKVCNFLFCGNILHT